MLPAFVAALTLHEFAHAWTAHKLGDDTAERQGRLTIDPLAHLDPLGTLIIVVAIWFNAPLIGWAKPVPFNPRNLRHPQRDSILIAIAGPISNILQMGVWLLALWAFKHLAEVFGGALYGEGVASALRSYSPQISSGVGAIYSVLSIGIVLNLSLAVFNMIPLPPLDGHYVLENLGPPFITDFFNMIRPYSFLILLVLIQTPVFDMALDPFSNFAYTVIQWVMTH